MTVQKFHNNKTIGGTTRVLGIFGDPVAHSLSPAMQNAALQAAGIDAVYLPFLVHPEALVGAVRGLRDMNLLGVNVTIPHKEAILPLLDQLDPAAELIGAVNTVVNRNGVLVGYNTDGLGLLKALSNAFNFQPGGRRILLLGAGGACRAALVALAQSGAASLAVANRNPNRSRGLVDEFIRRFPGTDFANFSLSATDLAVALEGVDLVINTTSIGLKGDDFTDFPWSVVSSNCCFYDMVYRRGGTPWQLRARALDLAVADGLGMLAGQGEEAFLLWTGKRPPNGVMEGRLLSECAGN